MATFTIDLFTGKLYLFTAGVSGSTPTSGTTGSTYPLVNTYADLPSPIAHTGEIYAVRSGTGTYVASRKDAGLYFSNGVVWSNMPSITPYFDSSNFQVYDSIDNTKGIQYITSGLTSGVFRKVKVQNSDGTIAYLTDVNTKVNTSLFNTYTGNTATLINNKLDKSIFNSYTGGTGLQQVTNINASTNIESTFSSGLKVNKIRPTADSGTAIQIHKADGVTHVVNIDTISGFTGLNAIAPKSRLHVYGNDTTPADGWNIQSNGIRLDGVADADKDISWLDEGSVKWVAQIFRGENGKYWYLFNPDVKLNALTVSDAGRIGINNQTNIMDYHAVLLSGNPNDINVGGIYSLNNTMIFQVEINGVGNPNTYRWRISTDLGITFGAWSSTSGCTLTPKVLNYGVTIYFDSVTGHTLSTLYVFAAFGQLPIGTFVVTPNKFNEIQSTSDYTGNPIIYNDVTAKGNNSSIESGYIKIFNVGVTKNAVNLGALSMPDGVYVNIATGGTSINLVVEYWNGASWIVINSTNNYFDGTHNLTSSGNIIWDTATIGDSWVKAYLTDLVEPNYNLFWFRLRTTTNPIVAPIARSFARNGAYRIAVMSSPSDITPSFYVDSLGRTNIGGGVITGSNKFQVNSAKGLSVASVCGGDSYVEFDSEDSSLSTLRLKVASNDSQGTSLEFGRTRGTLDSPLSMNNNDLIGRINFKGRVGSSGSVSSQIASQYLGDGSTTRCADLIFGTACGSCTASATEKVRIRYNGNTGFGVSGATATVHIKAGTSSVAPLKFTAGPLLSVPQVGAIEFDGYKFYFTVTGSTIRKTFASLESPQFSGNTGLPSTTCLNGQNLCSYILQSGGTNNTNLVKTCTFNAFTGNTQPIIASTITGATNGLIKSNKCVGLGGALSQHTVITGNTFDFTLSTRALNLYSNCCINIHSCGNNVEIRGNNSIGVEKTKFILSDTQVVITDSRTIPVGIQYYADYSSNYTSRSLVDKGYVDSVATGLKVISSVLVTTLSGITLTGAPKVIDGISVAAGQRVLVKNQIIGSENGIYVVTGGTWQRALDYNLNPTGEISNGDIIPVISGTSNGNTLWVLTTPDPIVSGNTLSFSLFSKTSSIIGGNGICSTLSNGNYVVSIKSPSNCGLCIDGTGLYINSSIAGTGLDYAKGVLSICGSALAGNSISWTGNTFNVNPATGTLSTALSSKLNTSTYQSYTGATAIAISCRLLTSIYSTYTGTTAPAAFASKSAFNLYTGTTVPTNYYNKTQINTYTGGTNTTLGNKAYLSGATFTGVVNVCKPAQNDNSNCAISSAWYISQCGTATPLMNGNAAIGTSTLWAHDDHRHPIDTSRLAVTVFSGYTGTTLNNINSRLLTTIYQTYTGTTAPSKFASKSFVSTYTGTTAPATFASKSAFNLYTGTTAPNTYVSVNSPTFTGTVTIPTPFVLGAVTVKTTGTELNYVTGATSNIQTQIGTKANINSPTFTGTVRSVTPAANDNSTCIATTGYYFGQCAIATPLVNSGTGNVGTSALWAKQDHVHPIDTSRLAVSTFSAYSGTTVLKAGSTMIGALIINSNLTITGTTILRGTTCLGTPTVGDITTDYTLFRNPTSCAVRAIKLTGGSDSYFYTDSTALATSAGAGISMYLSGTPWTFKAGRYAVDFNAQFGNTTNNGITCIIFALDGATIGTCYQEGGQVANWVSSASLSRDITLGAGCHCLTIQFARGANTSCVTYGMIRAKRIC